MNLLVG